MPPPMASTVFDLHVLSPTERERVFEEMESVLKRVLIQYRPVSLRTWYLYERAHKTQIELFRDRGGTLVGFEIVLVFEERIDGVCCAVFRSLALILPDYRGQNATLTYGIRAIARYKIRHPRRAVYFLGALINPAPYRLLHRYAYRLWPCPERSLPIEEQRVMRQLARAQGIELLNDEPPFLVDQGVAVRDNLATRQYWERSTDPGVRYFLRVNPDYAQGRGLLVLIPLTAHNVAISAGLLAWRRFRTQCRSRGG